MYVGWCSITHDSANDRLSYTRSSRRYYFFSPQPDIQSKAFDLLLEYSKFERLDNTYREKTAKYFYV